MNLPSPEFISLTQGKHFTIPKNVSGLKVVRSKLCSLRALIHDGRANLSSTSSVRLIGSGIIYCSNNSFVVSDMNASGFNLSSLLRSQQHRAAISRYGPRKSSIPELVSLQASNISRSLCNGINHLSWRESKPGPSCGSIQSFPRYAAARTVQFPTGNHRTPENVPNILRPSTRGSRLE